jgi:hypothetical protein
MEPSVLVK